GTTRGRSFRPRTSRLPAACSSDSAGAWARRDPRGTWARPAHPWLESEVVSRLLLAAARASSRPAPANRWQTLAQISGAGFFAQRRRLYSQDFLPSGAEQPSAALIPRSSASGQEGASTGR